MFRRIGVVLGGHCRRPSSAAQLTLKRNGSATQGTPFSKSLALQAPRKTVSQSKNPTATHTNTINAIAKSPKASSQSKNSRSKQSLVSNAALQNKTSEPGRRRQPNKAPILKNAKSGSQTSTEKKATIKKRPHAHAVQKMKYNKRVAAIAKLWRLGKKKAPCLHAKSNTSK